MAWNDSGDDRVKRYKLYKELEERYQDLLKQKETLENLIKAKDVAIATLAKELSSNAVAMPDGDMALPFQSAQDVIKQALAALAGVVAPDLQKPPQEAARPLRKASGVVPRVDKDVTPERLMANVAGVRPKKA